MHDEVWNCRDGRKIPVADMDVDHMRNVLRMLIRSKRRADRRKALALEIGLTRDKAEAKMLSEFWQEESLERFGDSR